MNDIFFIEGLGILATFFLLVTFQIKKPRHQLLFLCIPNFLWIAHFILLGALSGAAIMATATLRNFLGAALPDKYLKASIFSCVALSAILTTLNATNAVDFLPLLATTSFAIATTLRASPARYRQLCALCESLWLIYGIILLSSSLILASVLAVASVLISIARFDLSLNASMLFKKRRLNYE